MRTIFDWVLLLSTIKKKCFLQLLQFSNNTLRKAVALSMQGF